MKTSPRFTRAHVLYRRLQRDLCAAFEDLDGQAGFRTDDWNRPAGGGGSTRVLTDGPVLEKAAVNVSAVWGEAPPHLDEHLGSPASHFAATGISLIIHPRNPYAPTMHANLRYFETDGGDAWCGGGADLTPYYLFHEDARHFHAVVEAACGRHPVADYSGWKRDCDEYFYLPHRGEARGVGGIFFDHLADVDGALVFQEDLGDDLLDAYRPLVERRSVMPYGPEQERWHLQRRGRYVEFNLVHDRGTRFGLQTGGRIESILVSMPPRARWDYSVQPRPGTPEAELLDVLTGAPRDWTKKVPDLTS